MSAPNIQFSDPDFRRDIPDAEAEPSYWTGFQLDLDAMKRAFDDSRDYVAMLSRELDQKTLSQNLLAVHECQQMIFKCAALTAAMKKRIAERITRQARVS